MIEKYYLHNIHLTKEGEVHADLWHEDKSLAAFATLQEVLAAIKKHKLTVAGVTILDGKVHLNKYQKK